MQNRFYLGAIIVVHICMACTTGDDPVSADIPKTISEVPRMTVETLKARLDGGQTIMVVDVRSKDAFDAGHIPEALNIPYSDTSARLNEFPQNQDIVFYCT